MSAAWNVFRKMTDEYGNVVAVCTLCSRSLKVPKSKTTTNLLAHLRNNHCDELGGLFRRRLDMTATTSNVGAFSNDDHRTSIHRRLARLIVDSTIALETPSLKSFREFISALNPSYHIPSTKTLRHMLEEDGFRLEMANRALIADSTSSKMALTVDFHPAFRSHTGLLLISGHMLSQNTLERRNIILDCVPIELESFSGYAVSEALSNSLRRYQVDASRISAIVAKETQAIQEAAHYLHAKFVPCVAECITLAVSDTVRSEHSLAILEKLRRLIKEVQRNWSAKAHLKSRMRELKQCDACPALDMSSRWDTTYEMICDVVLALPVFNEVVLKLNMSPLDSEEVRFLEAMRALLEPYHTLTKQVCARDATCSVYLAVGRILMTTTEKYLPQMFGEAQQFGRCLLENTSKYFNPWLNDDFLQTSSFLDPRFANLETIQSMKSWTETIEKFIASQRTTMAEKTTDVPQVPNQDWAQSQGTSVWEVLRETREEPDVKMTSSWTHKDVLRAEIQHYGSILLTSRPTFGSDPVYWWRAYMSEFPHLAKIAFEYLSAPATAVDCERLFSLDTIASGENHHIGNHRKLDRLLLTLKANLNKDVARECKAWSLTDLHRYSFEEAAVDNTEEFAVEDGTVWTQTHCEDVKPSIERGETLLSLLEGGCLDEAESTQQQLPSS